MMRAEEALELCEHLFQEGILADKGPRCHAAVEAFIKKKSERQGRPRLTLSHQCKSQACNDANCKLCRHATVKPCSRPIKPRYRVRDPIRPECAADVVCTLVNPPASIQQSTVLVKVYLIDAVRYSNSQEELGPEPTFQQFCDLGLVLREERNARGEPKQLFQNTDGNFFQLRFPEGSTSAVLKLAISQNTQSCSQLQVAKGKQGGEFRLLLVATIMGGPADRPSTSTSPASGQGSFEIPPLVTDSFMVATNKDKCPTVRADQPIKEVKKIGKKLTDMFADLKEWAKQYQLSFEEDLAPLLPPGATGVKTAGELKNFMNNVDSSTNKGKIMEKFKSSRLYKEDWMEVHEVLRSIAKADLDPRAYRSLDEQWTILYRPKDSGTLDLGDSSTLLGFIHNNQKILPDSQEARRHCRTLDALQDEAKRQWAITGHPGWEIVPNTGEVFSHYLDRTPPQTASPHAHPAPVAPDYTPSPAQPQLPSPMKLSASPPLSPLPSTELQPLQSHPLSHSSTSDAGSPNSYRASTPGVASFVMRAAARLRIPEDPLAPATSGTTRTHSMPSPAVSPRQVQQHSEPSPARSPNQLRPLHGGTNTWQAEPPLHQYHQHPPHPRHQGVGIQQVNPNIVDKYPAHPTPGSPQPGVYSPMFGRVSPPAPQPPSPYMDTPFSFGSNNPQHPHPNHPQHPLPKPYQQQGAADAPYAFPGPSYSPFHSVTTPDSSPVPSASLGPPAHHRKYSDSGIALPQFPPLDHQPSPPYPGTSPHNGTPQPSPSPHHPNMTSSPSAPLRSQPLTSCPPAHDPTVPRWREQQPRGAMSPAAHPHFHDRGNLGYPDSHHSSHEPEHNLPFTHTHPSAFTDLDPQAATHPNTHDPRYTTTPLQQPGSSQAHPGISPFYPHSLSPSSPQANPPFNTHPITAEGAVAAPANPPPAASHPQHRSPHLDSMAANLPTPSRSRSLQQDSIGLYFNSNPPTSEPPFPPPTSEPSLLPHFTAYVHRYPSPQGSTTPSRSDPRRAWLGRAASDTLSRQGSGGLANGTRNVPHFARGMQRAGSAPYPDQVQPQRSGSGGELPQAPSAGTEQLPPATNISPFMNDCMGSELYIDYIGDNDNELMEVSAGGAAAGAAGRLENRYIDTISDHFMQTSLDMLQEPCGPSPQPSRKKRITPEGYRRVGEEGSLKGLERTLKQANTQQRGGGGLANGMANGSAAPLRGVTGAWDGNGSCANGACGCIVPQGEGGMPEGGEQTHANGGARAEGGAQDVARGNRVQGGVDNLSLDHLLGATGTEQTTYQISLNLDTMSAGARALACPDSLPMQGSFPDLSGGRGMLAPVDSLQIPSIPELPSGQLTLEASEFLPPDSFQNADGPDSYHDLTGAANGGTMKSPEKLH